jgi:hypothetical protein
MMMRGGAQKLESEFRRDDRFQTSYYATGEHSHLGQLMLKIVNLSSTGAMVDGKAGLERGDRIILRLPAGKHVDALCLWTWHQQAGLQFDQPLSFADLTSTIGAVRAVRI